MALVAEADEAPWVVRCGGPNSGHTTSLFGHEHVLRQLPAAVSHSNALLLLAAGCVIDEDVLLEELSACGLPRGRVVVDPRGVLVTDADREAERAIAESIGSTA